LATIRTLVVWLASARHPGVIGVTKPDSFQKLLPLALVEALKRVATDCEDVAHQLAERFRNTPNRFSRYSIAHDASGISLEDWERISEMETHTKAYVAEVSVSESINTVVKILCQSSASDITLRSPS
jgi:hypothetical protein